MNLIESLRSMGAHMVGGIRGMSRRKFLYEKYSDVDQFSVNTHVWFWRNNVTFQSLLLNAVLAMTRPTPPDVGPTVQQWRSTSPTANWVTRCFMESVIEHRKAVTISEVEVETERRGDEFTITFLAKIRGGGGAKTTHQGRLPVLCTMDDAMASHYLERLCERVLAQACVDYNNAKTEAELRDESALASDLARYVAFKESFHAPPSFTAPNKYT